MIWGIDPLWISLGVGAVTFVGFWLFLGWIGRGKPVPEMECGDFGEPLDGASEHSPDAMSRFSEKVRALKAVRDWGQP